MKPERKDELLARWFDEHLTEAEREEFEPLLREHPEWEGEREDYRKLRAALKESLPAEQDPPYTDFFHAHLARRIRHEREAAVARKHGDRSGIRASWRWWLAPATAGAMLLAFFAGMQIGDPSKRMPPVASVPAVFTYTPLSSVEATAMEDAALGGTVIVLEGLDALPDSVDLFQTAGVATGEDRVLVSTTTVY
jgi:hypothetical protein